MLIGCIGTLLFHTASIVPIKFGTLLVLKEIRIPVEEGPTYRRGQFYLDIIFNGQNGIHDCHEYEEKLLPFMRKQIPEWLNL